MKKKDLFTLTTITTVTLSICIGIATFMSTNDFISLRTRAENDYTLTIDASNKSNFVQDGDVYRGTFKTGLGNDIVFKTKSAPSTKEGVALEMTSANDYLINETPLRGVTRMDITGHYLSGTSLGYYYALYVYYLADPDMANLDTALIISNKDYYMRIAREKVIEEYLLIVKKNYEKQNIDFSTALNLIRTNSRNIFFLKYKNAHRFGS